MKENILKIKSFDFAVRIINLYKYLKKEFKLSYEIINLGTVCYINKENRIKSKDIIKDINTIICDDLNIAFEIQKQDKDLKIILPNQFLKTKILCGH